MTAPDLSSPRERSRAADMISTVIRRPRLLIGAGVAVVAFFLAPSDMRLATRALIGWNAGAWLFLVMIAGMMTNTTREMLRAHAHEENEEPWVLLIIAVVSAVAAFASIVLELGPVKDMTGWNKGAHIALVVATILSAWTFTNVMFALHYASAYYAETPAPDDALAVRGGLLFPGNEEPGWGDFVYQAFVIGCACATADVNITTRSMRSVCLAQGIVAFLFNTIVLALTINIGAGFI